MDRFNGLSFDIDLGDFGIKVKKFTLDIEDGSAVAKRDGRPDGELRGAVSASGEIVVYRSGLKSFTAMAKKAGSFQQMPTFDINSFGKVGDDELKIEAFGCKVKLSKLLDIDKESSDETEFTLPFEVTGRDFVKIDGVPYAAPPAGESATT